MNNKELTELKERFMSAYCEPNKLHHKWGDKLVDGEYYQYSPDDVWAWIELTVLPHLKSNDEVGKAPKAKYIDKYAERIITPEQELIIANGVDELQTLDSLDEIKREAEPVLCFVEGDTAYFTTQPLNKQWGDDWNDAPYEHNAGTPYEDHSEERWNIYTLKFDWDAEQPKGEHYNSPYSVEDINGGKVPWLKPSKWIKDGKNIYAGATMRDFAISIMSTGGNVYRRLYEGDYLYPTKGKQ